MAVTTTTGEAAVAVAASHQARRTAIRATQMAAIIAAWRSIDPENIVRDWTQGRVGERIYVLISIAQQIFADDSRAYVNRALGGEGYVATGPALNSRGFAGIASDGRDLETLLQGAPIRAAAARRRGESPQKAMLRGEMWLRMVAETQMADQGRAADSVAIATTDARRERRERIQRALQTTTLSPEREADIERRLRGKQDAVMAANSDPQPEAETSGARPGPRGVGVKVGYIRMLTPPSCSRCVVLAGRWYRWNKGFERHPMCDCEHIPAVEAIAGDVTVDPDAYFASLSRADQDIYFGKANAEAIRSGADIGRVVNAQREGAMFTADDGRRYTRAGGARRRRGDPAVLRPTVWQIYKDSRGSREAAVQMLTEFGYLLT